MACFGVGAVNQDRSRFFGQKAGKIIVVEQPPQPRAKRYGPTDSPNMGQFEAKYLVSDEILSFIYVFTRLLVDTN